MKWLEKLVYSIVGSGFKRWMVILLTIVALVLSIMMLPSKLVLARMLPGKSANTFSVYVDTPTGSSMGETRAAVNCVADILKQESEVTDMQTFLGQGSPLDYA